MATYLVWTAGDADDLYLPGVTMVEFERRDDETGAEVWHYETDVPGAFEQALDTSAGVLKYEEA